MAKTTIAVGDKFNKLTVIGRATNTSSGKAQWLVICDCGESPQFTTITNQLTSGRTKSCGCARLDRYIGHTAVTKDVLYRRWATMVQRCINPNTINYRDYGGRGVSVCREWQDSFLEFKAYIAEIHPNYLDLVRKKYQIDRIDNDGNYEPGNIRLVSASVNSLNKRPPLKGSGPNSYKYVEYSRRVSNLAGQVFGELTAIEPAGGTSPRGVLWVCICSCGGEKITAAVMLTTGKVKSCGHLKNLGYTTTHGLRKHPLYDYWNRMRGRAKSGKIEIIDVWQDFTAFYTWAVDKSWGRRSALVTYKKGEVYGPETCYFKPTT